MRTAQVPLSVLWELAEPTGWHCDPAARTATTALWGQVVTAARGAGRCKSSSRAGVGQLHSVCMSLEPCWTACQGARIPPFTSLLQGLALSSPVLKSHIFLMLQVTQGHAGVRMCPLLLLLLLRDLLLRRMDTLSPPHHQKAKQLLDRGEGLCVTLASSPRAATKQPHPSPTCFTWGLWPNSSIMCRSNEAKLVSKSHSVKAVSGPGLSLSQVSSHRSYMLPAHF